VGKADTSLKQEQERFELIFENSPVAIWEEDLSALIRLREDLKKRTVTNLRKYLLEHPDLIRQTYQEIKILNINRAALQVTGAETKEQLVANLGKFFTKELSHVLVDKFVALLQGKQFFQAELKVRSFRGKVYDALLKVSIPAEYVKTLRHAIVTLEDITESKKMERHLRNLAQVDSLTKLYNHRTIIQRLEAEFARAKRYGSSLSVMMIDVDHFKVINDAYGHQKGDQIIRRVAAALKKSIRQVDVIGRYGGDEFFIILPETKAQNAKTAAARIQNIFATKGFIIRANTAVKVALSIGISGFPANNVKEAKDLITRSDNAMYAAKKAGRNRIVLG